MRYLAATLALAAALSGSASAEPYPYWPNILPEDGQGGVRNPVITVPEFDRESEVVAYRVHPFDALESDIPFFIDRAGFVVRKPDAEAYVREVRERSVPGTVAVFICSLQAGDPALEMTDPRARRKHCALR